MSDNQPEPDTQPHENPSPADAPSADSLRSLDWIRTLVAIDTTSRNSNHELISAAAEHCRSLGLEPRILPGEEDGKFSLIVTVPAQDGSTDGGVLVSGHTDTVPVDGQDWDSSPFEVREADGRLYGRGVADMKGYIATALASLPQFTEAQLVSPLHIALSYDEELGCVGGAVLVRQMQELGIAPRIAFVGEPTSMEIVRAHKSMNVVKVRFTGVPAHSSNPGLGVNSIGYASELVLHMRSIADAWRRNGPFDEGFAVPHSTLAVTMINGGTAANIVPGSCEITFEFRTIAEVDPQSVIDEVRHEAESLAGRMQREHPQTAVEVDVLAQAPALSDLEEHTSGIAADVAAQVGATPNGPKVSYGTEAGQFQSIGIDAVVCGPGDIAQAHTPNEWIEIEQLAACERFFDALLERLKA